MTISEKLLAELAIANKNYGEVCDLFGLTEDERRNEQAGQWIIERIKQFQTAYTLNNALRSKTAYPVLHPVAPNPITDPDKA